MSFILPREPLIMLQLPFRTIRSRRLAQVPLSAVLLSTVLLGACGGGNATVGGTLIGLGSGESITVQNNGTNTLTLTANGGWAFPAGLANGNYDVTIATQPVGQVCSITGATGTFNAVNGSVTSVAITCGTSLTITGTLSGLATGLSVSLSDGVTTLPLTANGTFSFSNTLTIGNLYTVAVTSQPVGQTCTVSNPTFTATTNTPTNILVNCV